MVSASPPYFGHRRFCHHLFLSGGGVLVGSLTMLAATLATPEVATAQPRRESASGRAAIASAPQPANVQSAGVQAVLRQEGAILGNSHSLALGEARTTALPPASPPASQGVTTVAASSVSPRYVAPTAAASHYSSEDELIQKMTGQATPRRAAKVAIPNLPVFSPPGPVVDKVAAKATGRSPVSTFTPLLVSAGRSNADIGMQLLSPGSRVGQSATYSSVYVPLPVPALAQMTLPTQSISATATTLEQFTPPATRADTLTYSPRDATLANASRSSRGQRPVLRSTALTDPSVLVQGVYIYQGDKSSARGRLAITYPLTPRFLFGATFDLTDGNAFADSRETGFDVNELYFAASLPELPNLRIVAGLMDLTSYFDRNSFAKDGATHFFNTTFQTNPALSATGISSRPGILVNWSLTDNIEAKAAVFSSDRTLTDFALDGFAAELGVRYGNLIVRGTFASDRDAGQRDGFQEIFNFRRGDSFGPLSSDREQAYGINAEVFIPSLKMGIFGRYGRYDDLSLNQGGDTYSAGISFLDLFGPDDRFGIAYGRGLSNDNLRRSLGEKTPDVLEVFYDFRLLPNLRLGFTVQQRNDFSETIAGVRLKTEFDVSPVARRF